MLIHQASSPSASPSQSSNLGTNHNDTICKQPPQAHSQRATAGPRSGKGVLRHLCALCDKSYDRADHLSRHLRSHDNTRPFLCSRCGKGFNRPDLLNRHVLAHVQTDPHAKAPTAKRPKDRTAQACTSCVTAKAKCEDKKPCKRCRTRGVNCVPPNASASNDYQLPSTTTSLRSLERSNSSSQSSFEESQDIQACINPTSPTNIRTHERPGSMMDKFTRSDHEILDDLAASAISSNRTNDLQSEVYPSFFEQIMTPQANNYYLSEDLVVPPDVSKFVQDMDFSLDDFDLQFSEPFLTMDFFQGNPMQLNQEEASSPSPSSTLSLRADAFQISPWEWTPPRNHDSLSKQKDISISEGNVPQYEELLATMQRQCLSELLDVGSRDKIFKMVLNICSSNHSISTFPSQALLAKVMQVFYIQETESLEGRVYSSTLNLSNTRPELLLAIIAAGAVTVNCDAIQKMGIAFQEVVRLAVGELFERDNSMTRDIQALQAYILWLDVGFWSGYKRSMEIAGGFLQPLYTLLTKAKAFARDNHLAVSVSLDDTTEVINLLWQNWRAKESLKRIGIQAFLHDSRSSLALLRNPIISYAQMTVPLPCMRDLWMASDSQAWAELLISETASILQHSPTLMDVFSNIEILDGLQTKVDTYLCFLTTLHAIAAQVWDYRQRSASTHNVYSMIGEDINLLNDAFQSQIYKTLNKLRLKCDTFGQGAPEVILLAEFLMMFLNVSLDDVQRFAGKDGERDAREIVPSMREWCRGKAARRAIWHAGQVLRAAKSFRRAKLRGFHAVAVYFSALTLWVYSLIINDADLRSGVDTPIQSESMPCRAPWQQQVSQAFMSSGLTNVAEDFATVALDGPYVPEVRFFIMFNQGQPGLTSFETNPVSQKSFFCSLRMPKSVILNAVATMQGNYSQKSDAPPLIVRTLLDLMKKLAELSGKKS